MGCSCDIGIYFEFGVQKSWAFGIGGLACLLLFYTGRAEFSGTEAMLVLLGAMHLCCVWHHCFKMPALQLGSHVFLQFCSLHWSSFLHSKEHIKVHQPFYLSGSQGCYNRLVTGNQLREGSAGPFHEEAFQLWEAQTVVSSAISLSVCVTDEFLFPTSTVTKVNVFSFPATSWVMWSVWFAFWLGEIERMMFAENRLISRREHPRFRRWPRRKPPADPHV